MTLGDLFDHCMALPGAWEDQPFGPDVLVFKVRKKMFAMINLEHMPHRVALKGDPERWVVLKERHEGITRGPYLDGKHWNSVDLASDVPAPQIRDLVNRSYSLVVAGMTKKEQAALADEVGQEPGA
ncbi:MAG: MmcQ/YjbR family DNA-binding protein [Bacteroidota bacterium]